MAAVSPLAIEIVRASIDRGGPPARASLLTNSTANSPLTLSTYSHVLPQMQQQTAAIFDAVMKEQEG